MGEDAMAEDTDVIVVGGGLAGRVAATEIADAGKRVILLDQEGEQSLGGQAFWSFGGLFLVDSPEQRRLGIKDSHDLSPTPANASFCWTRKASRASAARRSGRLAGCSWSTVPNSAGSASRIPTIYRRRRQTRHFAGPGRRAEPRRPGVLVVWRVVPGRQSRTAPARHQGFPRSIADAGKRVILLDQEGEQSLGGQAFWSFGGLFLVDSPEQRRLGIKDSHDLALEDWLGTAGFDREEDHWPRRSAEAFVAFAAGE